VTTLAPVSVALKFGFLAVLYLFLLWVGRSARRDLRRSAVDSLHGDWTGGHQFSGGAIPPDATGMYSGSAARTSRTVRRAW
jgi:hypothetical protein